MSCEDKDINGGNDGENAGMGGKKKKQEPEIPITITMSSEVFQREEESSSTMSFLKALKAVNTELKERYPQSKELFEVKLLHENSSDWSERHGLFAELEDLITPLHESGEHLNAHLHLSAQPEQVQQMVRNGKAAAVVLTPKNTTEVQETVLRVVFDGDAVLFSKESEDVFGKQGLKAYLDHENEKVDEPMSEGPFKIFLEALVKLQKKFPDEGCPIRTYLVTSRDAGSAGYRALNTLKEWGLEINEAYFLQGSPKGPVLKMIRPHIFFDDQMRHVTGAVKEGIMACHVAY